jgi:peptidoglycan/xylan/chitin deacetylase (PgdA/CDA1 family)
MIFLYHGVVSDEPRSPGRPVRAPVARQDFERQVGWLARRHRIVPMDEYLRRDSGDPAAGDAIALTFDDGLRNTFLHAVPFLERHRIPATFFVTTLHVETRELLWFSCLNALCYDADYGSVSAEGVALSLASPARRRLARRRLGEMARGSGDPVGFVRELAKRYPVDAEVASRHEGMRPEELRSLADSELFEVGAHTRTHPFLGSLPEDAQRREVAENRRELGALCGKPVRYFAYPAGDYDPVTLRLVREAGYDAAFATIAKRLGPDPRLEIERIGVYAPSLLKVRLKTTGVVRLARSMGMRVG